MTNKLRFAITNISTQITLENSTAFPLNGYVKIENEIIKYNHSGDIFLFDCVRGALGTTAASHALGVTVTDYATISTSAEQNALLDLTSPKALSVDIIDKTDIIGILTVMADTLVLTLPSPTNNVIGRELTVSHRTGSTGTLSVNSVSLAAGTDCSFVWDGTGWVSAAAGGAVSFPVLADDGSATAPSYAFASQPGTGIYYDPSVYLASPGLAFATAGVIRAIIGQNGDYLELAGNMMLMLRKSGAANDPAIRIGDANDVGLFASGTNSLGVEGNGGVIATFTPDGVNIGSADYEIAALLRDGNLSRLGLGFQSDLITGLYHPGPSLLGIVSNGDEVARFDNSGTAGETRFMLWDVDNGAMSRVTVGAADSGGTGFKLLRVPN